MTKWDEKRSAPKGLFRVMGEDPFPQPPEEYWVGDYASYEDAREAARANFAGSDTMTVNIGSDTMTVYDDAGKTMFIKIDEATEITLPAGSAKVKAAVKADTQANKAEPKAKSESGRRRKTRSTKHGL